MHPLLAYDIARQRHRDRLAEAADRRASRATRRPQPATPTRRRPRPPVDGPT